MRIFIAGGTGFIGGTLVRQFTEAGHEVTVLVRRAGAPANLPNRATALIGDPTKPGPWQEQVALHQVVINLTGAPIFHRWTREYKKLLYESRILSTRNIVDALPAAGVTPCTLINASAIGYYGFHGDDEITETAPAGRDFLAELCVAWENEAFRAKARGVCVLVIRIAPVLGQGGGALAQMLPIFRLGLGGRLGHGRQWFSWIHIDDFCRAILFLCQQTALTGPVNFCAPNPVTNRELTAALGHALHKPAVLPVPGIALKLVLGEMSSVLLEGCRVLPQVLCQSKFVFGYQTVVDTLHDLVSQNPSN